MTDVLLSGTTPYTRLPNGDIVPSGEKENTQPNQSFAKPKDVILSSLPTLESIDKRLEELSDEADKLRKLRRFIMKLNAGDAPKAP